MIGIAIAEDIATLAEAMKKKLSLHKDFKVVHVCGNGRQLIDKLNENQHVDVILMDIKMPEMDGIEATAYISNKWPQIKIIMCTVFDDDEHIFNAILAGASGYLMKDERPDNLFRAIHESMEGGAPMSPQIARRSLQLIRSGKKPEMVENTENYNLTSREIEILEHLSKGLNYASIAENLYISQGTVRKHIENIYKKLQVGNKVEAIKLAEKNKLI